MTSLTLKNLPDDLLRDLREAAEEDRRSLTQEIIHLLDTALRNRHPRGVAHRSTTADAQVTAWRALAGRWESDLDPTAEAEQLRDARTGGREVDL